MGTTAPRPEARASTTQAEQLRVDSSFDPSAFDGSSKPDRPSAWIGWRRRALVLAALLGCLGVFTLARSLAAMPQLDAGWRAGPGGELILHSSALSALRRQLDQALVGVQGEGQPEVAVDALALHRALRWQSDDAARARQIAQQTGLHEAQAARPLRLRFADGQRITVDTVPRGYAGLGLLFWPLVALALLVYLLGVVLLLARPQRSSLLFVTMTACQAAQLVLVAIETVPGVGLAAAGYTGSLPLRMALDLATAAAASQAWMQQPRRLPRAGWVSLAGWCTLPLWLLLSLTLEPAVSNSGWLWWSGQTLCLLLAGSALAAISHSYRLEPNPYARVIRQFATVAVVVLAGATLAIAASAWLPAARADVAETTSVGWIIFLASLLLLTPSLGRGRRMLREFALLAGVSTVATSLDLLFVAVFSLGSYTSLAMAVFIAMALYAGARQWVLSQLLNASMLTTERTFDRLYRAAREVQAWPARYPAVLASLLQELFDPLEVQRLDRVPVRSRVVGSGAALLVPLRSTDEEGAPAGALALRFAYRGQRLFSSDDARLADRVIDQLRRAVAYDQAVERGRAEERQRIAQDLHDDIGARLLTLMYQAQSREMEDYIRHTLQDLKTLTRGLAASEHRLSHAAAEWKADLSQRMSAAHASLGWSFDFDHDPQLSVVQWSALTRVLRELVSNALYHGHATQIDVQFSLLAGQLMLQISDDGEGRDPQGWAHGLGLGGVRKRVKLLGGKVAWRENEPRGIVCALRVADFIRR